MEARSERNCCRCAVVPFVLTASVDIDVGDAKNNGHGLCSGRTHLYELCVQFIGNGVGAVGGCMVHNPGYDFNDGILSTGAAYWVKLAETALAQA